MSHNTGAVRLARGHLPELDGVRGIAVLMVLLLHTRPTLFFWGWAGVDLFLVLSGFLITRILLQNRDQPGMLWSFYGRRALRIWPVYYLTLLLTAGMAVLMTDAGSGWSAIPDSQWLSAIFLQNTEHYAGLPERTYLWYFRHSWSVAVEEHFYLIWPLLLVSFAIRPSRLAALGIVVLIVALATRLGGMFPYLLVTRVDGLVLGAALAFSVSGPQPWLQRLSPRHFVFAGVAAAALVVPYLLTRHSLADAGLLGAAGVSGFALGFATLLGLVLRNLGHDRLAWLRSRPLRWVGRISYGLYMYHVPAGALCMLAAQQGWIGPLAAKAGMWVTALLAAHLSYELVEKRILAIRRIMPYRSHRASGTADMHERADILRESSQTSPARRTDAVTASVSAPAGPKSSP